MEICEHIRQTLGMKELYAKRKETIERIFGSAKKNHGFRYTQMYGKARMEMKVGLTVSGPPFLDGPLYVFRVLSAHKRTGHEHISNVHQQKHRSLPSAELSGDHSRNDSDKAYQKTGR